MESEMPPSVRALFSFLLVLCFLSASERAEIRCLLPLDGYRVWALTSSSRNGWRAAAGATGQTDGVSQWILRDGDGGNRVPFCSF